MKRVYLSLGSNMGDRLRSLQTAIRKLRGPDLLITKISSVYETAPVEFKQQPDFLNIVLEAETSLLPLRLLHRIQTIERDMGRKRIVPKGPRVIDIDILLHGSSVVNTQHLQIPHPRMPQRRFVIEPLTEIAPDLRHPVTRQSLKELLAMAPHQLIRRTPLRLELPGSGDEERA